MATRAEVAEAKPNAAMSATAGCFRRRRCSSSFFAAAGPLLIVLVYSFLTPAPMAT